MSTGCACGFSSGTGQWRDRERVLYFDHKIKNRRSFYTLRNINVWQNKFTAVDLR